MSEIKNDELNQATETNNIEAETPIVEEINESKTKTTIADFFKKCFSKEKLKKTIAVILLAAIVIGGVCGVISYNSPKSVAKRFIKAVSLYDYKTTAKLSAYDWYAVSLDGDEEEVFFDEMSDRYDEDITSWQEYFKVVKSYGKERHEDWYGKYKYSFTVARVKDLSERKLKEKYSEVLDAYEEASLLDADNIGKGKEVTVKSKLESEEDGVDRATCIVTVVKISGAWKVLTFDTE